jgi:hypothetical protein
MDGRSNLSFIFAGLDALSLVVCMLYDLEKSPHLKNNIGLRRSVPYLTKYTEYSKHSKTRRAHAIRLLVICTIYGVHACLPSSREHPLVHTNVPSAIKLYILSMLLIPVSHARCV